MNVNLLPVWIWLPIFFIYFIYLYVGVEGVTQCAYTKVAPFVLQLIQDGVALNTIGSVHKFNKWGSEFEFSGSATKKAILSSAVLELNMEMENLTSYSIIHVETLNWNKKINGLLLRRKVDNTVNALWKGAAEMVLKTCSTYYDASGIVKDLDNDNMLKFEYIIQGMLLLGWCHWLQLAIRF